MDELNSGPDLPAATPDVTAVPAADGGTEPPGVAPEDILHAEAPPNPNLPPADPAGLSAVPAPEVVVKEVSRTEGEKQPEDLAATAGAEESSLTVAARGEEEGEREHTGTEGGEAGGVVPANEPGIESSGQEAVAHVEASDSTDNQVGGGAAAIADPDAMPTDALEASLDRSFGPAPSRPQSGSPTPMPSQTFLPPTTRTLTSPPPPQTYTFVHADEDAPETGTGIDVGCAHADSGGDEDDGGFAEGGGARGSSASRMVALLLPTSPTAVTPEPTDGAAVAAASVSNVPAAPAGPVAAVAGAMDREEVIAGIKAALDAKEKFKSRNVQLQNALGEYFRRKRQTEETRDPDPKPAADLSTRYTTSLSIFLSLRATLAAQNGVHSKSSGDYHTRLTQKRAEAAAKGDEFRIYKRTVALAAENSRTGKSVPAKVIEALEAAEERKEAEVVEVRLGNIKLRNRLKRSEGLLRQKEELADGLHLIDFEQLKIENSTHTSKIESRNEDLLKLRKKITTIVQVLTHVKEKLHHTAAETRLLQAELARCDEDVLRRRDAMPAEKKKRDKVRKENRELKRRAGLLGEDGLLRDFEERVDQTSALQGQIQQLQRQHAEYAQEILAIKRKIQKTQILAGVGRPIDPEDAIANGREIGW
ncbi:Coiled-coil domain-containing protein 96 [Geranomyces michiganensis]|nr:Coiled-coil domain-containing protein 96 [Geranomyces michiganensis]